MKVDPFFSNLVPSLIFQNQNCNFTPFCWYQNCNLQFFLYQSCNSLGIKYVEKRTVADHLLGPKTQFTRENYMKNRVVWEIEYLLGHCFLVLLPLENFFQKHVKIMAKWSQISRAKKLQYLSLICYIFLMNVFLQPNNESPNNSLMSHDSLKLAQVNTKQTLTVTCTENLYL